jgi:hypothetical protein
VVTPSVTITTTLESESTPMLLTLPMVMVRTTVPPPGMEILPDQQQAYQEE